MVLLVARCRAFVGGTAHSQMSVDRVSRGLPRFWVSTVDLKVCLKARGLHLNPWTCHGMRGPRHVSATYRGRLSVKSMMSSSWCLDLQFKVVVYFHHGTDAQHPRDFEEMDH